MKVLSFATLLALALLSAGVSVAQAQTTPDSDLSTLLAWVAGDFDTTQQAADRAASPAPERLFAVFAKVHAPALGREVIYLQWAIDSPQGRLQRQRIWTFEVDASHNVILMDFFTLRDPDRWRDAHLQPETALSQISRADVIPYPPACRLPFRREGEAFVGEIPRGQCRIISQQTRTDMTIHARIVVTRDKLGYDESGVRQDGTIVFKVPSSGSYEFRRRGR